MVNFKLLGKIRGILVGDLSGNSGCLSSRGTNENGVFYGKI